MEGIIGQIFTALQNIASYLWEHALTDTVAVVLIIVWITKVFGKFKAGFTESWDSGPKALFDDVVAIVTWNMAAQGGAAALVGVFVYFVWSSAYTHTPFGWNPVWRAKIIDDAGAVGMIDTAALLFMSTVSGATLLSVVIQFFKAVTKINF